MAFKVLPEASFHSSRPLAARPKTTPAAVEGLLERLLVRFQCNNFSIWDELILALGQGVFPLGALLNHSCDPNCVLYYDPLSLHQVIRTIKSVKEGEELCHAYIDIAVPTPKRRAELRQAYHFDCHCSRCSHALLDHRLGDVDAAQRDEHFSRGWAMLQQADGQSDLLASCAILSRLEATWTATKDPLDLSLLSLRSKLLQGYLEVGENERAIPVCAALVGAYREIYGDGHPLLGLQLYTLGDLLRASGREEEARRRLEESHSILRHTHGDASGLVQGLHQLLA